MIGISAGNHAQALAYCAALEGVDALIVMWQGASPQKIEATRAYGAEVDLEADGPATAFERLHELMARTGRALVHPFDDPMTIAGQGTVGLEAIEDVPETAVLVVPVGGGGSSQGSRSPRKAAESSPSSPSSRMRSTAGSRPASRSPSSRARCRRSQRAVRRRAPGAHLQGARRESVLVSEDEIADGMRFLYGRAKLACEPAAAVGVAALLAGKVAVEPHETVVVVVSGGNVSPEMASAILG